MGFRGSYLENRVSVILGALKRGAGEGEGRVDWSE